MIQGNPVLSLDGVSLRWGSRWVVSGLTMEVKAGEILGFLGPNGSGKSTTLAAITSQKPVDEGEIRIGGITHAESPELYKSRLGYVPQDLAYYEELSARENLLFFGRMYGLHGRELRERVADALDFVHLGNQADRKPNSFSGGMQRRLNIACALLHDPLLLLLDEPTVGLDVASREAIYDLLSHLRRKGRAIVLTTHLLEEAATLCDQVAILNQGKLLAHGSIQDVCAHLDPALGYFASEHGLPTAVTAPGIPGQAPMTPSLSRMLANLAAHGAVQDRLHGPGKIASAEPTPALAGSRDALPVGKTRMEKAA
ncbi:MAG: ABC transporter ATP-binding protein [Planctomycetota bacterium]|nr:ABC transporter ATP-binding protein [Planctomycetota bacterium]